MEVDSPSESTTHDRIVQVRLFDFPNLIIGILISLPAVHWLNYLAQEVFLIIFFYILIKLNFVECAFSIS